MKYQIGAMTVGDILDRSLKMLLGNLPAFYLIHLLVLWPIIIYQLAAPMLFPLDSFLSLMISAVFVPFILTIVLQSISTAAILHIISQDFVGRQVTVGNAMRFALRRFATLLGTSILMMLALAGGYLLCVIPMFLFWVWFVFYAQVVVVEDLGGTSALSRSKALTKGFRWRILGILLLVAIIVYVIALPPTLVLNQVLPTHEQVFVPKVDKLNPFELGYKLVPIYPNVWINVIVAWLFSILAQAYGNICVTLLYFDLRNRKEGFDLELAAQEQLPAEQLE